MLIFLLQPFNSGEDSLFDEYREDGGKTLYGEDEDSNEEDNSRLVCFFAASTVKTTQ